MDFFIIVLSIIFVVSLGVALVGLLTEDADRDYSELSARIDGVDLQALENDRKVCGAVVEDLDAIQDHLDAITRRLDTFNRDLNEVNERIDTAHRSIDILFNTKAEKKVTKTTKKVANV